MRLPGGSAGPASGCAVGTSARAQAVAAQEDTTRPVLPTQAFRTGLRKGSHTYNIQLDKYIYINQMINYELVNKFQMLEWIVNHRTAFLSTYVEIGRSCAAAKRLQEEHARFVNIYIC